MDGLRFVDYENLSIGRENDLRKEMSQSSQRSTEDFI